MMELIRDLFKAGALAPPVLVLTLKICMDAQNAVDSVTMQMTSQLPFAYAHLLCFLVHGAMVLNATTAGLLIALASCRTAVICQIWQTLGMGIIYLGLLSMSSIISDPFGDDIIDFPQAKLQQELWRGFCLVEALPCLPPRGPFRKEDAKDDSSEAPTPIFVPAAPPLLTIRQSDLLDDDCDLGVPAPPFFMPPAPPSPTVPPPALVLYAARQINATPACLSAVAPPAPPVPFVVEQ